MGLFERLGHVLLIFEPVSKIVIHQLARVKREVSVFNNQVWDALIEVCDLGDFGGF